MCSPTMRPNHALERTRRKRRAAERTRYAERCTSRFSRWVLLNGVASRSAQPRDSHRDESPPALLGPLMVVREYGLLEPVFLCTTLQPALSTRSQFGEVDLGGIPQLKLSSTRRSKRASTVFGSTTPLNFGIVAASLMR